MDDRFREFRAALTKNSAHVHGDDETTADATFVDHLKKGAVTAEEFADIEITQREPIFDDWCLRGDLGFIFAPRGLGKTWLTMHLAHGAASNLRVGPWEVHGQRIVLYIDGEMLPWDVKTRLKLLGAKGPNFIFINHEILCDRTDQVINLARADIQDGILAYCKEFNVELLCLDNLSCLASGVDENVAISWECIQSWLLLLRRIGVTVIFIHHAGRNGRMRGSSKREDLASWIMQLDYPIEWDDDAGAQFITRFTKWRCAKQPPTYHWTYKTVAESTTITFEEAGNIDVFISHVDSGLDTCSDIAAEMNLSKGHVSRLAQEAVRRGRITIDGRKYKPRNEDPY